MLAQASLMILTAMLPHQVAGKAHCCVQHGPHRAEQPVLRKRTGTQAGRQFNAMLGLMQCQGVCMCKARQAHTHAHLHRTQIATIPAAWLVGTLVRGYTDLTGKGHMHVYSAAAHAGGGERQRQHSCCVTLTGGVQLGLLMVLYQD